MSRKNQSKNKNTSQVKREGDPIPWRYCLLTLVCGLLLVVGFFFAARQHFSSIDYGIKNSQLKRQKDELETAQRQLVLAKESALSPSAIKKVAKQIGFTDIAESVQTLYTSSKETTEKPKTEKISLTKTTDSNSVANVRKDEKKTEKKTVETIDSKTKKGVQQAKLGK